MNNCKLLKENYSHPIFAKNVVSICKKLLGCLTNFSTQVNYVMKKKHLEIIFCQGHAHIIVRGIWNIQIFYVIFHHVKDLVLFWGKCSLNTVQLVPTILFKPCMQTSERLTSPCKKHFSQFELFHWFFVWFHIVWH